MVEKWLIYNSYIKKGEEPNEIRLKFEEKLRELKLANPYAWFSLIYNNRIKLGIKLDKIDKAEDIDKIKKRIKEEFSKEWQDYRFELSVKEEEIYNKIAIATQCRKKLEEKINIKDWNTEEIAQLLHFMLNPSGYNFEAKTHLQCLLDIGYKVNNPNLLGVIGNMVGFLNLKNEIELKDNKWIIKI